MALLAARAPKLRQALRNAKKAGHAYLVIDGTLIPIDRVAADRPFYSGKHRKHGTNLQVISGPDGEIVWVSGPLLALWLYDDWCIGANDFRDNSPTRLLLFGCSPSDTSQLWNLG